jgi:hypothetical protein
VLVSDWLFGIMFGIIFYVALNETDKKEDFSSEEEQLTLVGFFVCGINRRTNVALVNQIEEAA